MKRYLSFGGGVNSTALMLWLLDQGIEFEAVYADHGADWPETREYVAMLREQGYPITVLETRREGRDLYSYYLEYRIIPVRIMRACTDRYKVRPLQKYQQKPCIVYMGFSADEAHRARPSGHADMTHEYPLIDEGIDRKGCIEIIKRHGLPVPIKSGCFLCPFQRKNQWRELRTKHPELYCKAKRLEDATNERLYQEYLFTLSYDQTQRWILSATREQLNDGADNTEAVEIGRNTERWWHAPMYIVDRPLDIVCQTDQPDLWGERDMRPCLCEL